MLVELIFGMNNQLFFVLECNLKALQIILRGFRHSAFLTSDDEIGIEPDAKDSEIIQKVAAQKQDLGIDRR